MTCVLIFPCHNFARYYSASIIKMSGVRSNAVAIWLSAVTAGTNCVFSLVGLWLVERVGRRPLLLGSSLGQWKWGSFVATKFNQCLVNFTVFLCPFTLMAGFRRNLCKLLPTCTGLLNFFMLHFYFCKNINQNPKHGFNYMMTTAKQNNKIGISRSKRMWISI